MQVACISFNVLPLHWWAEIENSLESRIFLAPFYPPSLSALGSKQWTRRPRERERENYQMDSMEVHPLRKCRCLLGRLRYNISSESKCSSRAFHSISFCMHACVLSLSLSLSFILCVIVDLSTWLHHNGIQPALFICAIGTYLCCRCVCFHICAHIWLQLLSQMIVNVQHNAM